jgi:hypothetical protein
MREFRACLETRTAASGMRILTQWVAENEALVSLHHGWGLHLPHVYVSP